MKHGRPAKGYPCLISHTTADDACPPGLRDLCPSDVVRMPVITLIDAATIDDASEGDDD